MKRAMSLLRAMPRRPQPLAARRHRGFVARRREQGAALAMVLRRAPRIGRAASVSRWVVLAWRREVQRAGVALPSPARREPSAPAVPAVQHVHLRPLERLVERLHERHERHLVRGGVLQTLRVVPGAPMRQAPMAAMRLQAPLRIEQAAAFPPVQVRMAARAAAVAEPARSRDTSRSAWPDREDVPPAAPAAFAAPAARAGLPPAELSRVTEHVLAQLDARVLSWQERHERG